MDVLVAVTAIHAICKYMKNGDLMEFAMWIGLLSTVKWTRDGAPLRLFDAYQERQLKHAKDATSHRE